MRKLQNALMTHLHAKKRTKAPAKAKITGKVSSFNAKHIALQTAKGVVWKIDKTPNTKVTGTLKRGSTVTVEFSKKNGRQIRKTQSYPSGGRRNAGKRTELQTGTVIGLTAQQITLDNTTPTPGPWIISQTDVVTAIVSGTLALGATAVTIRFSVPPGQQVNA
jgi:hypothetical protein